MKMISRADVLFEYRSKKQRAVDHSREEGENLPPVYLPYSALAGLSGYQSQFGVTKAQAAINMRKGSTKGARYAVYSDTLLLDFDDCVAQADQFESRLRAQQLAYIRAHSGGRSDHFHVPIVPCVDIHLAYSCRVWVTLNAPGADLSVYHRNGMFRLFGTRHERTGKPKQVVRTVKGGLLTIPIVEEIDAWGAGSFDNVRGIEGALSHALALIGCEPGVGNRHQALWSMADSLLRADVGNGLAVRDVVPDSIGFVQGLLYAVNASFNNPKPVAELERIMNDLRK